MPDLKISELDELVETPNGDDYIPVVDVSDISSAPTGKTKKVKVSRVSTGGSNSNLDGGVPNSLYGGTQIVDGGTA